MVVKEQLKILEERMTRLETKLIDVACFENVPKNTPKGSEAVDKERSSMIPHLLLAEFRVDQDQQRVAGFSTSDEVQFFTASEESDVAVSNVLGDEQKRSSRSVCWLSLLEILHRNEAELKRYGCYSQQQNTQCRLVSPAMRLREMSFNLKPPDNAQVSAVTTVHEISLIARRLGMSWEDFNPELGSMRAKGNGHGLFSTLARSTGIVLQYIHLEGGAFSNVQLILPDTIASSKAELFIPSREADMMGFGILPGCERLGVPNFKVGTKDEVYATMDLLDSARDASTKLRNLNRLLVGKWDAHCMYGFSDIIALAAPMIRRRNSTIVRLPPPAEYSSSLLSRKECFMVFRHRLKDHLSTQTDHRFSEQATWILKQCEQLTSRYSEWETNIDSLDKVNGSILNFLEEVHDCWDRATEYLEGTEKIHQLHYPDLMASHISHAVNYWVDAWQQLKQSKTCDDYGHRDMVVEGSHLYFDYLPLIVEDMRAKGFKGPKEVVHEAWFTLMFRAFCWWRCHSVYPGENQAHKGSALPSRYWGCEFPVYIR